LNHFTLPLGTLTPLSASSGPHQASGLRLLTVVRFLRPWCGGGTFEG